MLFSILFSKDGFAKRGTLTIETLDKRFQDKIGQRDGFSPSDIKQINQLYKCGEFFYDTNLSS